MTRTKCLHPDGCVRLAVAGGDTPDRCKRHGGGKRCLVPGCSGPAYSKGLCLVHGPHNWCTFQECRKFALAGGMCTRHGGGKRCLVPQCVRAAVTGGVADRCKRHGGGKRCVVPQCPRSAFKHGHCYWHDPYN